MKRFILVLGLTVGWMNMSTAVNAQNIKPAQGKDIIMIEKSNITSEDKSGSLKPAAVAVGIPEVVVPPAPTKAEISSQIKIDDVVLQSPEYIIGIDDVLEFNILEPEKMSSILTVAMDGTINVPYAGNILVKGLSLHHAQQAITDKLSDGFMKYPIVAVSLKESRSKKFFVYGEVNRPGTYLLSDRITVLKAISTAGGFTKYGSASRVKVLRPKSEGEGYQTIKVNLNSAMEGKGTEDVLLLPGDMIVVSEGIF